MNNFKNNNRRSRFKPTGDRGFRRNGNGHKPNGDFNNGSSFKRRYPGKNNQNAAKLVEKYNDLAREALSNGDKILSENYLQHSEHFSRILISQENSRNQVISVSVNGLVCDFCARSIEKLFSKEKSVLVAKPTACEDISASIKKLSHLIVSSICLTLKNVYFLIKVSSK